MNTLESRVKKLELSRSRQRWVIAALAVITLVVAVASLLRINPKEVRFESIACNRWSITDSSGKARIVATTGGAGDAAIEWLDSGGRTRLIASASPDGVVGIGWLDGAGTTRLSASSNNEGLACAYFTDQDGKLRIAAATTADGQAAIQMLDRKGTARISSIILPDGSVVYPSSDTPIAPNQR